MFFLLVAQLVRVNASSNRKIVYIVNLLITKQIWFKQTRHSLINHTGIFTKFFRKCFFKFVEQGNRIVQSCRSEARSKGRDIRATFLWWQLIKISNE